MVIEGDVVFNCKSIVIPKWTFEERPLPCNARVLNSVSGVFKILITRVQLENYGTYQCEGKTNESLHKGPKKSFTATGQLYVYGKLIPSSIA